MATGSASISSILTGCGCSGHGGDTAYFHSLLAVSPELGFGVFVSQNSLGNGGSALREVLVPALAKRYFARERPAPAEASARIADALGRYMVSRRSDHSVMRVLGLMAQVEVSEDHGEIVTNGFADMAGNPARWREVAPDRFRLLDGRVEIEFQRDAGGRVVRALPPFPGVTFERIGLLDSAALAAALGGPALVIVVFTLGASLAGGTVRRALGAPPRGARPWDERLAAPVAAALWVAVGAGIARVAAYGNEIWRFSRGEDGWLQATLGLAWAAVAASGWAIFVAQRAARDPQRSHARRILVALPALAFLALSWLAWNWGLVSNPARY